MRRFGAVVTTVLLATHFALLTKQALGLQLLLPLPRVMSIIARVADALDYAHKQRVVHRDIKPANIMYDPGTDTPKVADFGIARITDSSKTKTGMVPGTPSYTSPEQLAGKKIKEVQTGSLWG